MVTYSISSTFNLCLRAKSNEQVWGWGLHLIKSHCRWKWVRIMAFLLKRARSDSRKRTFRPCLRMSISLPLNKQRRPNGSTTPSSNQTQNPVDYTNGFIIRKSRNYVYRIWEHKVLSIKPFRVRNIRSKTSGKTWVISGNPLVSGGFP